GAGKQPTDILTAAGNIERPSLCTPTPALVYAAFLSTNCFLVHRLLLFPVKALKARSERSQWLLRQQAIFCRFLGVEPTPIISCTHFWLFAPYCEFSISKKHMRSGAFFGQDLRQQTKFQDVRVPRSGMIEDRIGFPHHVSASL